MTPVLVLALVPVQDLVLVPVQEQVVPTVGTHRAHFRLHVFQLCVRLEHRIPISAFSEPAWSLCRHVEPNHGPEGGEPSQSQSIWTR